MNPNIKSPPPVQNMRKIAGFVSSGTRFEWVGDQRMRYVVRRALPITKNPNTS